MTRLDLNPDNELVATFKKALSDIEELKQRQALGKDSIRPKIVSSPNAYDVTAEYVPFSNNYLINIFVRFQADNQLNPYASPYAAIFDLSGNRLPVSTLTYYDFQLVTVSTTEFNVDDGFSNYQALLGSDTPFRAKLYYQVSDSGTISFEVFQQGILA